MIRKYHNHKPQTTPWHREEEPLNHHETPGKQIKQSNQLSLNRTRYFQIRSLNFSMFWNDPFLRPLSQLIV